MTWYSLGLAESIDDATKEAWRVAWEVSQVKPGVDPGSAIFSKIGPGKRPVLYFTPSSQMVAESFGARPCAKPLPDRMSLVAGSERAWQAHFGLFRLMRQAAFAWKARQDGDGSATL